MDGQQFLDSKQIIENTDITFRTKVKSKNSLLTYDIERKTMAELLDEFAAIKTADVREGNETLNRISAKNLARITELEEALYNLRKIYLYDLTDGGEPKAPLKEITEQWHKVNSLIN